MIVLLVELYYEAFVSSVFVAVEDLEKFLDLCQSFLLFIDYDELVVEHYWLIDNRQVVFVNHAAIFAMQQVTLILTINFDHGCSQFVELHLQLLFDWVVLLFQSEVPYTIHYKYGLLLLVLVERVP